MAGRRGFLVTTFLVSSFVGCTHFREGQAITAFTDALVAGDMQQLRDVTSTEFEQKALRRSEALDDLHVLRLPEQPPSIVKVKDVSETEKEVTVTEPGGATNLLYRLVLDGTSNQWVVDDIFTKQQQQGVTVAKPITEQMDLLLTIRDFLEAWDEDNRERVLAVTTPEFRSALEELPAPWLARITQQVVGSGVQRKSQRKHKPQVAIDGPEAVVRLPRSDGTLQLSLSHRDGIWRVDDAAVQSRRNEYGIRSVRNRARIIAVSTQFVEAFRTRNDSQLRELATKRLYDSALEGADLRSASIPDIMLAPSDYELKATVDLATMLVPTPERVVRIELERLEDDRSGKFYRVAELGLYDADAKSELLLSSYFTAQKRAREFHIALLRSDKRSLSRLSSARFNEAVWSQAVGLPIQLLPVGAAGTDILKTATPKYDGAQTKVRMQHEGGAATYVLVNAEGRLVVDDVLVGPKGRSLRTSLEVAIPILAFATGVRENKVRDLQRVSSDDFNRLVWSRAKSVPELSLPVLSQLTKPIRSMRTRPGQALVELGSAQSGAIVTMERDKQHWVIDDIEIINGLAPNQRVQLKETMRTEMIAELKGLRSGQQIARSAPPSPDATRAKRFDLSLKQPTPRKSLAMSPAESRSVVPPVPAERVATKPIPGFDRASEFDDNPNFESDVTQVAGARSDSGVQQAVLFSPMEDDKAPVASAVHSPALSGEPKREPNLLSPEANAEPLGKRDNVAGTEADLDALFADFSPTETAPTKKPSNAAVGLAKTAEQAASPQRVNPAAGVPLNDTSRVTDPALQPIRIPQ